MAEQTNTNTNTNPTTTEPNTEGAPKTYTQEEVEKMILAESDKRVNQALQRKERELSKKLTEAEKLGKMSQEEQFQYKLEQKERELAEKEREYNLRDMKIQGMKILSEKQIPADLIDFVVAEDAETMSANIQRLDKYIKASIAEQVKARLASPTPTKGLQSSTEITKEQFARMTMAQRTELYESNRELYNKLKG